jgi:hypothetical protein
MVNKGCDTLDQFPYTDTNYTKQPDDASFSRASQYKAASWSYLANNVNDLKAVLANGNTLVMGIAVLPDFDSLSPSNPVYDDASGTNRGYHALCIVGYDDTKNAFKFINSWGSWWGIDGYGWISYDFVKDASPVGFWAQTFIDKQNTIANKKKIHYYNKININSYIHFKSDSGIWSTAPGYKMNIENAGAQDGWFVLEINDLNDLIFCFNDGQNRWDSKNGANYSTSATEIWVKNQVITLEKPKTYGSFSATLTSTTGKKLQYASVYLNSTDASRYDSYSASTDANGYLKIDNVVTGNYAITAYAPQYYRTTEGGYNYNDNIIIGESSYSRSYQFIFTNGGGSISVSSSKDAIYYSPVRNAPVKVTGAKGSNREFTVGSAEYGRAVVWMSEMAADTYTATIDYTDSSTGLHWTGSTSFIVSEDTPSPSASMKVVYDGEVSGTKKIHYYNTSYANAYIHFMQDNGNWTNAPGIKMYSEGNGWYLAEVQDQNSITFCFNNGAGTWDSKNGYNYSTALNEVWVKNQTIFDKLPSNKTKFRVVTTYSPDYTMEIRGNKAPLSWSAPLVMTKVADKTYEVEIEIDGSFEYKYTTVDKATGATKWEALSGGGNRTGSAGNSYSDTANF